MNRTLGLLALAAIAAALYFVNSAEAQAPTPIPSVWLQNATPGTTQTGNANVNGTVKAGQFVGGGAGVTGVNADLLDGINSTAFLQSIPVPLTLSGSSATHVIKGENTSTTEGAVGVLGLASGAGGFTYGVYGRSDSTDGRGVYGLASATFGFSYGGQFESNSTSGTGVFGIANASTGFTAGVYGRSFSTQGIGIYGHVPSPTGSTAGVLGLSSSTSGLGVYGGATAATGTTYGGVFESASTSGTAIHALAFGATGNTFGGWFQSESTGGTGVRGMTTSSSGSTYGGYFTSASTSGTGVYGEAEGSGYGVRGVLGNPSGLGNGPFGAPAVLGESSASNGVLGVTNGFQAAGIAGYAPTGYGVYGFTTSYTAVFGHANASSGTNYGTVGSTNSLAAGWGMCSYGDIGATGTKFFRIDHPMDPENKYLLHYATEGNEPFNAYSGNVTTDLRGYATVALPDYFEEINRDFRYQLTVVDDGERADFVMVKVVKKIRANSFVIRTSAPNLEVSWRVEAIRNDRYTRAYRKPVEMDKPAQERGKYQHPELYGMPKERGIIYRSEKAESRQEQLP